jgi:type IV secretory pathway VirB6-like protein
MDKMDKKKRGKLVKIIMDVSLATTFGSWVALLISLVSGHRTLALIFLLSTFVSLLFTIGAMTEACALRLLPECQE